MDDDIWREEMRKDRCSSPSVEDEDVDAEGGQSEAVEEGKQPEGGEMEHEGQQARLYLRHRILTASYAHALPCLPPLILSVSSVAVRRWRPLKKRSSRKPRGRRMVACSSPSSRWATPRRASSF